jgi:hypothetical protein
MERNVKIKILTHFEADKIAMSKSVRLAVQLYFQNQTDFFADDVFDGGQSVKWSNPSLHIPQYRPEQGCAVVDLLVRLLLG